MTALTSGAAQAREAWALSPTTDADPGDLPMILSDPLEG